MARLKHFTVLFLLLVVSVSCAFAMDEKQSTTFRVKWSKTVEATSLLKIMDYDGNSAYSVENVRSASVIDLDPVDDTTPVPAFMIRFTTNKRGNYTITVSATMFKDNQTDERCGYIMQFPDTTFDELHVEQDNDFENFNVYVSSLNGEVDTDIKVDVVFNELDQMDGGSYSSVVTVSCCPAS